MTGSNSEPVQDEGLAHLVQEIDQAGRSGDAETLQGLLGRARDRLSFYEGFDRVIADNVRRSGELMLESLTLRDQIATEHGQVGTRERAALLGQIEALQGQFASISAQVEQATHALTALRQALGGDVGSTSALLSESAPAAVASDASQEALSAVEVATEPDDMQAAGQVATGVIEEDAAAAAETSEESIDAPDQRAPEPDGPSWDAPRVIEVIAHDVAKAATALALQNHLRGLDGVSKVDAREFASGVLRLQVTANAPLSEEDFSGWDGAHNVTVAVLQDEVVELRFGA